MTMKPDEIIEILKPLVKKNTKFGILSDGLRDKCILIELNYGVKNLDKFKEMLMSEYNLNVYHDASSSDLTIMCFDVK